MKDLRQQPADWVQLLDEQDGLTVVDLDDAAADGAPWDGFGVPLAVAVHVARPDPTGQPYDDEHAALLAWQDALVAALGDEGRLVATITMGGVREFVAYLRSPDVVLAWQAAPPPALGTYEADVELLPDPGWLGLREIAGLLGEDEEPLRAPG